MYKTLNTNKNDTDVRHEESWAMRFRAWTSDLGAFLKINLCSHKCTTQKKMISREEKSLALVDAKQKTKVELCHKICQKGYENIKNWKKWNMIPTIRNDDDEKWHVEKIRFFIETSKIELTVGQNGVNTRMRVKLRQA